MICELYENKSTSYELLLVDTFENCVKKAFATKINKNSIHLYHIKHTTTFGLTLFNDDDGNKILYVYDCTPQSDKESLPQLLLILSPNRIGFQTVVDRSMYNLLHIVITHWKE